jgi:hypothetical protein
MKKITLAAWMVLSMVSVAQAGEGNADSTNDHVFGHPIQAQACEAAKDNARLKALSQSKQIVEFKKCECNTPGNPDQYKWVCNVGYTTR